MGEDAGLAADVGVRTGEGGPLLFFRITLIVGLTAVCLGIFTVKSGFGLYIEKL